MPDSDGFISDDELKPESDGFIPDPPDRAQVNSGPSPVARGLEAAANAGARMFLGNADYSMGGIGRVMRGIYRGSQGEKLGAAADITGGIMRAATVPGLAMAGGAIAGSAAPLAAAAETGLGIGASTLMDKAGRYAARKLGGGEDAQELTGNITGAIPIVGMGRRLYNRVAGTPEPGIKPPVEAKPPIPVAESDGFVPDPIQKPLKTLSGEQQPMEIVPQEQPKSQGKISSLPPQPPPRSVGSPKYRPTSEAEAELSLKRAELNRESLRLQEMKSTADAQKKTESLQGPDSPNAQMGFPFVDPNEIHGPAPSGEVPISNDRKPINSQLFEEAVAEKAPKSEADIRQIGSENPEMGVPGEKAEQGVLWSPGELEPFKGTAAQEYSAQRQKLAGLKKSVRSLDKEVNLPGDLAIGEQGVLPSTGEISIPGSAPNSIESAYLKRLHEIAESSEFSSMPPDQQNLIRRSIAELRKGIPKELQPPPTKFTKPKKTPSQLSGPPPTATGSGVGTPGGPRGPRTPPTPAPLGLPPEEFAAHMARNEDIAEAEAMDAGTIIDRLGKWKNKLKRQYVSSTAPINDRFKESLAKAGVPDEIYSDVDLGSLDPRLHPTRDLPFLIGNSRRSDSFAVESMRKTGVIDALKSVAKTGELKTFAQILKGKQLLRLESMGIKTGVPESDLIQYKNLIDQMGKRFEPESQAIQSLNNHNLDYAVQRGLITQEFANKARELYPDYVPLERIYSRSELPSIATHRQAEASLTHQDIYRAIEGGEAPLKNPLKSFIDRNFRLYQQGERNEAAKAIVQALGEGYESPLEGFKDLGIRELKGAAKMRDAENTISYLDNGVKRTFEVPPEISAAAKGLSRIEMDGFIGILYNTIRVARLGVVGLNPFFAARNLNKDAWASSINTPAGKAGNPVLAAGTFIKSLFSATKHDEMYQRLEGLGATGSQFDAYRGPARITYDRLDHTSNPLKNLSWYIKHPGEATRAVENILATGEETTRQFQFRAAKKAALKNGLPSPEAEAIATRSARETTADFLDSGDFSRVANGLFMFMNARIQGSRIAVRSAVNHPAQTAVRYTTMMGIPVALATAWNLGYNLDGSVDMKRREIYKDLSPNILQRAMVIVGPNAKLNSKTGRYEGVYMLPLPPGEGDLASLARRPLEILHSIDPQDKTGAMIEIAKTLYGAVSPFDPGSNSVSTVGAFVPQFVKPAIEAATNKDMLTGNNIVPDRLAKVPPALQKANKTSSTMEDIAQVMRGSNAARFLPDSLGPSPMQTEHLLRGTFGSVPVDTALSLADRLRGKEKPSGQGPRTFGESAIQSFTHPAGGGIRRRYKAAAQERLRMQ